MDFVSIWLIREFILVNCEKVQSMLNVHVSGGTVWFEAFIGDHSARLYTDSVIYAFKWYEELKFRADRGPIGGRYLFETWDDYYKALREFGEDCHYDDDVDVFG